MGKTRQEREAEFKAKIAELDAYVKEMNAKGNLTDEEMKEVASLFSNTKADKVKDLQRFVSNLQGKRVIVVSPED